jgi:hypothetical protein
VQAFLQGFDIMIEILRHTDYNYLVAREELNSPVIY